MTKPQYGDDTRADLANTGIVYDDAIGSSAGQQLSDNLRGTESARGLLKADDGFNKTLAMDPMSGAIKQKFQNQYANKERAFKHEQAHEASAQHFDKLAQASELVQKEQQMNFQKRMEKFQQDKARKRARGAVVSQVLGVVGAVIGGIYSGGTAAAAGYAGGVAVGNAIQGGD